MRRFQKIALAATTTFALILGTTSMPAQAASTPAFNISLTGGTLGTSTITGFAPDQVLILTLSTPTATLTFDRDSSSASLVNYRESDSNLMLLGTQAQLLTALASISIDFGCMGAPLAISATITTSGFKNEDNGHYYRLVPRASTFEEALALSAEATFDGTPTGSPGYLTTITSAAENQFITDVFLNEDLRDEDNYTYFAGTDKTVEGTWEWAAGPESGEVFFSGRSAVNGSYTNWDRQNDEPNNFGPEEDRAMIFGHGVWNDSFGTAFFIVEWGGMPGDDFSSWVTLSDTDSLNETVPFAVGEGTAQAPYEVSTLLELSRVGSCSGDGVFFKQTADFDLTGLNVASIGTYGKPFIGNYDGFGHSVEGISVRGGDRTNGLFGYVGPGTELTKIKNLSLEGSMFSVDGSGLGLASPESYFAEYTNIDVTFAASFEEARQGGGLVGYAADSVIEDSTVTGTIAVDSDARTIGGIVGEGENLKLNRVESNVTVTGNASRRIGGIVGALKGVGSEITNSVARGTINVTDGYSVGGLVGYLNEGGIQKSFATGAITSGGSTGGLLGSGDVATLSQVFATGDVIGERRVGGIAGELSDSTVEDSYSTGDVTGIGGVGIIVGYTEDTNLSKTHGTGLISLWGRGLIGEDDQGSSIENSFWFPTLNGNPSPITPIGNERALTALEAAQLPTYLSANWSIDAEVVDETKIWALCENFNNGTPFLTFAYPNACIEEQVLKPVPVITGGDPENLALTAVTGTWDAGTTLSYTWYADDVEISGASSASFTPTTAELGKFIKVKVTSTKPKFVTASATSSTVGPIALFALTLKPAPTISGTGVIGSALSANTGTWDTGVTLSYKWLLNGVEIADATSASFTPTKEQVGGTITVQVTGTKAGFVTESQPSSNSIKVKAVVIKPVVKSKTYAFGGLMGDSWWVSPAMKSDVRKASKANKSATTLVCVGIVKAGGSKSWMKALGLKRAQVGCALAKLENPKLKVSYKAVIAKPKDKIQRGFSLTFTK